MEKGRAGGRARRPARPLAGEPIHRGEAAIASGVVASKLLFPSLVSLNLPDVRSGRKASAMPEPPPRRSSRFFRCSGRASKRRSRYWPPRLRHLGPRGERIVINWMSFRRRADPRRFRRQTRPRNQQLSPASGFPLSPPAFRSPCSLHEAKWRLTGGRTRSAGSAGQEWGRIRSLDRATGPCFLDHQEMMKPGWRFSRGGRSVS
jgi:hypothetical protein